MGKPNWERYPKRICKSLHECVLCGENIEYGQGYRDGGWARRAHLECATDAMRGRPRKLMPAPPNFDEDVP
jgi:hypothetical protein